MFRNIQYTFRIAHGQKVALDWNIMWDLAVIPVGK